MDHIVTAQPRAYFPALRVVFVVCLACWLSSSCSPGYGDERAAGAADDDLRVI